MTPEREGRVIKPSLCGRGSVWGGWPACSLPRADRWQGRQEEC